MKKIIITGKMPAYSGGQDVSYPEQHAYEIDESKLYDSGIIAEALKLFNADGNAGHIIENIEVVTL